MEKLSIKARADYIDMKLKDIAEEVTKRGIPCSSSQLSHAIHNIRSGGLHDERIKVASQILEEKEREKK